LITALFHWTKIFFVFVFPNFDPSNQIVAHGTQKWLKETETKTGEGGRHLISWSGRKHTASWIQKLRVGW